jgi:hypothetical protein
MQDMELNETLNSPISKLPDLVSGGAGRNHQLVRDAIGRGDCRGTQCAASGGSPALYLGAKHRLPERLIRFEGGPFLHHMRPVAQSGTARSLIYSPSIYGTSNP